MDRVDGRVLHRTRRGRGSGVAIATGTDPARRQTTAMDPQTSGASRRELAAKAFGRRPSSDVFPVGAHRRACSNPTTD
jgi:hypothetical protein